MKLFVAPTLAVGPGKISVQWSKWIKCDPKDIVYRMLLMHVSRRVDNFTSIITPHLNSIENFR